MNVIKINTNEFKSNVFFGSAELKCKDKYTKVTVTNHLIPGEEYEFRTASKCRAGFITISDGKATPEQAITGWKKGALYTIEVKVGKSWLTVFATKGNTWVLIDKAFMETLTVGDIHSSFPHMADHKLWSSIKAKTWADKAFVMNK